MLSGTVDSKIEVWDLNQNKSFIDYSEHLGPVFAIDNLKTNNFLSGSQDSSLKLWDLRTPHSISSFLGHCDSVTSVKILNQYSFLSGSKDCTIKTWDIRTLGILDTLNTEQEVNCFDIINDFVITAGKKLQVWSKNNLLWETLAKAKCVKYNSTTKSIIIGSYDNAVSIYKIIF